MKRTDLLFSLFLLAGAVLLYTPSLGNGFVFDDEAVILGDPSLRSLENLPGFFLRPSFSYYRPLRSLSFALDYRVWGLNSFGYHLTSNLLHGLCALSFFLLLRNLGARFRVRVGAAILFLVHPIAVEAVGYISSRAELLGTLFALLFILAGVRFVRSGRSGTALLALVFLAAAFLSKESFAILPLLFPLLTLADTRSLAGNRRRRRHLALAALLLAAGFLVFRFFILRAPAGPDRFGRLLVLSPILILSKLTAAFIAYLRLLFFPIGLSPHHPLAFAPLPSPASLAAQIALAAGVILLLATVGKRYRRCFPGGAWFLVALLPISNFYPLSRLLVEKYLYFPLLGFSWLAAEFFLAPDREAAAYRTVLFGAAAAGLILLTVNRQPDWRDNYTLWRETAARSAPDPLILFNWGTARVRDGEVIEGLDELERAEAMLPGHPEIREKIADVKGILGRHEEALEIYRELLERFPDSHSLPLKAGFTCDALGNLRLAELHYREALVRAGEEGPERTYRLHHVYRELAIFLEARGEFGGAAELLEKALALFPGDRKAERKLARLYQKSSQDEKAEAILRKEAGPDNSPAGLFARGRDLERAGRFQEAMQFYHRSLKLDPAFAPPYFELGGLLAGRGEYEAAERFFRAGLKLKGDDYRHHTNLGSILQFQGKYTESAKAYRRSLELEESYTAHYNLGFLYLSRLFDPEAARTHLETARRLVEDPEQRAKLTAALDRINSGL
jgi:protein O-mannosyl-transferase